ncbi:hypothetical protein J4436_03545 [Candidatus Woesearchaeota archaeon]|nr:hypothetical protein [Candidatus Woesearchaeota archaeon]
MIFTPTEILYILITIVAITYIFSSVIKLPCREFNIKKIDTEQIKFAFIITAPAIILHEMGHKFIAIFMGLEAHYEVWFLGLIIGLILRFLNFGFIFLAPGYVTFSTSSNLEIILIAGAGPFINLILWLIPYFIIKHKKNLTEKTSLLLVYTSEINKWLFIFNMIPIPPLDGSKILWPLFS